MQAKRMIGPLNAKSLGYDRTALVLQGGGALGAYQAGVYQALCAHGIEVDWIAGISIGAINAALIAGNRPEDRFDRLTAFWETITAEHTTVPWQSLLAPFARGHRARNSLSRIGAAMALTHGQPGFFRPRTVPPWLQPEGTVEATSFYDTAPLRTTLERLIDFDRINAGQMRFSVGAVNVRTGNFVYFDNMTHHIGPEHVMASGALPPGFPAVEIDGEHYWDGGLVSNTPLQVVLESLPQVSSLIFQVDLWSSKGNLPDDLIEVLEREKDIRYSSRTRMNTDYQAHLQTMRRTVASLLDKLPASLNEEPEVRLLRESVRTVPINVIHLIYQRKNFESHSKDFEFTRATMTEHWQAGFQDANRTLRRRDWLRPPPAGTGMVTHDVHREGTD
jgi:NTE family protein